MSSKIMTAPEIRAELARRRITRRELSEKLNLSYSYVKLILAGSRDAEARRQQITELLAPQPHDMRGIA